MSSLTVSSSGCLYVCFSSLKKSGLDSVSSWLPLAEAWLPEVMILVCDRVCENGKACRRDDGWYTQLLSLGEQNILLFS